MHVDLVPVEINMFTVKKGTTIDLKVVFFISNCFVEKGTWWYDTKMFFNAQVYTNAQVWETFLSFAFINNASPYYYNLQ